MARLVGIAAGTCLPLSMVLWSVIWVSGDLPWQVDEAARLGVNADLGLSLHQVSDLLAGVMLYLNGRGASLSAVPYPGHGGPFFSPQAVRHMSDVRALFVLARSTAGVASLALLFVAAAAAVDHGLRAPALTGVLVGSVVCLTLLAAVGLVVVLGGFNTAFVDFHLVMFRNSDWAFAASDTLIRLYPDAFWVDAAARVGSQSAAILGIAALGGCLRFVMR